MGTLLGLTVLLAVVALLTGAAGVAVARLSQDGRRRPPPVRPLRWHSWLGYGLLGAGLLLWAVLGAVVGPAAQRVRASVVAVVLAVDEQHRPHELESERLAMFAREARWAAILLAVGGLVLLARLAGRRLAAAGVVLAWVVTDLTLETVRASPAAVVAAAAVLGGLAVLVTLRPGHREPATGLLPIVYSGASSTAAFPLVMAVGPWSAGVLDPWVVPLVEAQAALLVLAGVGVALAAAPTPTRRRVLLAAVVAVLGAVAAVAHTLWEFSAGDEEADGRAFLPGVAAIAVLVTVCAIACAGVSRPGGAARDRWRWVGVAAGLAVAAGLLIGIAFGGLSLLQLLTGELLPDVALVGLFNQGPLYVLPGILAGALLGLTALLPVARSHRAFEEPAPPPEEEPEEPRPVAVPGVPEILEWPPRDEAETAEEEVSAEPVIELGELVPETPLTAAPGAGMAPGMMG